MIYVIDAHQDISFNGRQVSGRDFFVKNKFNISHNWSEPTLNQSDYMRLQEGNVKIVFSVIFPYVINEDKTFKKVNQKEAHKEMYDQIDYYHELAKKAPEKIRIIKTKKDINDVMKNKDMIGFILLLEDAIGISSDLSDLHTLYEKGVRIIGPVWNEDNHFCGGTHSERGLTQEGELLLKNMSEIGFALDTAHMNPQGFSECLDVFSGIVINSHTGLNSINANIRNLSDNQLIRLKEANAVIGIPFVPEFLHNNIKEANLEHFRAHLEHAIKIMGIDAVAFGSDFDGMSWPEYMKDVQDVSFFKSVIEYLKPYYNKEDLEKLAHKNWERIIHQIIPD